MSISWTVQYLGANLPRWRSISWTVQYLGTNLPRCMSESWTLRDQNGEPSTPVVDIMDGSFLKHEPTYEAPLSRRSLQAASAASRRNAKGWPEAMVRTVCFHCNGTWAPGWYLISPDQALPNCVWVPSSSAEGGKSCEMRCHPGSWH